METILWIAVAAVALYLVVRLTLRWKFPPDAR
jgi:hypothetical protein